MRKWAGMESGKEEEKKSIEETSSFFGQRDQRSCCQKVLRLRAKAVTVANSCRCNKSLQ